MHYWFEYFTSRRYDSMYIGLGLLLAGSISMLTGWTLERYYGFVSRAEDPKRFRQDVMWLFVFGFFFVAMSLAEFYLYDTHT